MQDLVIKDRILTIRNKQVMLDRDLAELYNIETRVLKQAINRNLERFPLDFMFILNDEEIDSMVSQIVIPSRKYFGGAYPYAFTEQGVANLSSILKSKLAIEINIKIIRAFVAMRHYISKNSDTFDRLDHLEYKQIEYHIKSEDKFNKLFKIIESKEIPKQGIFYDGQVFDAYKFVSDLIKTAKSSIILIDNYVDDSVLTLFTKKHAKVSVTIYTKITKQLKLDLKKYNKQYQPIEIKEFSKSHDRFLIIDSQIYHIGASLKDLGKRWFAFSKLNLDLNYLLNQLN